MSGSLTRAQLQAEIARLNRELEKKNENIGIGRLTAPKKPRLGVKQYNIDITSNDPASQAADSAESVAKMLAKAQDKTSGFKVSQTFKIRMEKTIFVATKDEKEQVITQDIWLTSRPRTITGDRNIQDALLKTGAEILLRLENWLADGSNWRVRTLLEHRVTTVPYNPLRTVSEPENGGKKSTIVPNGKVSGSSYLELPDALNHPRKGLVNMRNDREDDNMCFLWCYVRHLRKDEYHPGRISEEDRKTWLRLLKEYFKGIKFPVELRDIPKIEKRCGVKVNVLGYDRGKFFPLYIGNPEDQQMGVMNLLLISDGKRNHYVLITNLSALLYNVNKHKGKKHFCEYCLQALSTKAALERHKECCITMNGAQATELPKEGSTVKFVNYHKMLEVPFVIYADLESVQVESLKYTKKRPNKNNDDDEYYCGDDDEEKETIFLKHKCCSFGYKVVCGYDSKLSKPCVTYRGENAARKFLLAMLEEEKWCQKMMKKHFDKPIKMSKNDEILFNEQSVCHICQNEIDDSETKVRDHCHYSGKFRGAAHQKCNSLYRLTKFIPVVFHNLGGYDAHFLVKKMSGVCENRRIGVIPKSMEKYMMVSWGHLKFIDSYQFMSSSLSDLVNNLPPEAFANTDSEFKNEEQRTLVRKKGVYPHEYFDGMDKFNDTCLPKKKAFTSTLNNKKISDDDYEHANEVWKTFGMKTLGDYHDLYLKCDVTLLADVFQEFRRMCMKTYELDPAHYVSSPGLSWDAMLKLTRADIELISDNEQYQFVERGMRGGVSCVSHRYARANNPGVPEYKKSEDKSYIVNFDFSGMYSWAMLQPLPIGGFRFLPNRETKKFDIHSITDDSDKGYFLEVDLDIDHEFHDAMIDYPPCPEKVEITPDMLSTYCLKTSRKNSKKKSGKTLADRACVREMAQEYQEICESMPFESRGEYEVIRECLDRDSQEMLDNEFNEKIAKKRRLAETKKELDREMERKGAKKLITTLRDKEKYVVHHKVLQLYVSLGVKIRKIHRVLEFDQEPFMRDYIKLNTDLRAKAKNKFEKTFFKGMNNSIYGKTCENLRKRIDVRLVSSKEQLEKMTSKPTFAGIRTFGENLVAVHRIKQRLLLNKPSYIGCAILDISKILVYDFHYNWTRKRYGDNAKLLYTDTDSLIYYIKTDNVYKDMQKDKARFDLSNYSKDSKYYSAHNEGVTGKMKDECEGRIIQEFVGLRSKMYSYLVPGGEKNKDHETNTVKRGVIGGRITHNDYLKTLRKGIQMRHKYKTILSKNHEVGTYEEEKVSLSSYDDKRFIFEDGISSVPYGHWGLQIEGNIKNTDESYSQYLG